MKTSVSGLIKISGEIFGEPTLECVRNKTLCRFYVICSPAGRLCVSAESHLALACFRLIRKGARVKIQGNFKGEASVSLGGISTASAYFSAQSVRFI